MLEPSNSHSVWLDIFGLTVAVTLLEAAVRGVGTTYGRGRTSQWRVAPWLRPVLAVVGLGLLLLVFIDFLRRF